MLSCACEIYVLCFRSLLVALFGMGALCCLKVVVADCWLCVVPPPQESMNNGSSLFNYGLDDPYNDLIDDFDPYLEYGKGYRNRTAFEDAFYG